MLSRGESATCYVPGIIISLSPTRYLVMEMTIHRGIPINGNDIHVSPNGHDIHSRWSHPPPALTTNGNESFSHFPLPTTNGNGNVSHSHCCRPPTTQTGVLSLITSIIGRGLGEICNRPKTLTPSGQAQDPREQA